MQYTFDHIWIMSLDLMHTFCGTEFEVNDGHVIGKTKEEDEWQ